MGDEENGMNAEENLAIGDTPSGNPAFLIYKKRLYILSKKPPRLKRAGEGGNAGPAQALEVQARRPVARPRPAPGRMLRRRTRPFVKGTYRVYNSKKPYLAPAGHRKPRKRLPRTLE